MKGLIRVYINIYDYNYHNLPLYIVYAALQIGRYIYYCATNNLMAGSQQVHHWSSCRLTPRRLSVTHEQYLPVRPHRANFPPFNTRQNCYIEGKVRNTNVTVHDYAYMLASMQ